jgi:hypothetical protein
MQANQDNLISHDTIEMLPKVQYTKEGYIEGYVVVTRTGVFPYLNLNGTFRGELRHPDEVFKQESINSLETIPITIEHPTELLNIENASKYQVGTTGQIFEISDNKIIVSIKITSKAAIEAIKSGKMELSLGYQFDLEAESGEYNGESYDAKQCNIRYNHLAIVKSARAGHTARFRLDSADDVIKSQLQLKGEFMEDEKKANSSTEETAKLKEEIKGLKVKLEDKKEPSTNMDTMDHKANNDSMAREITKLQEEVRGLKSKPEGKEEPTVNLDAMIEKKAMERASLMSQASPFLNGEDISRNTDRQIMESTIKSFNTDSADFSRYSDDYVKGVFDTSVKTEQRQHMNPSGSAFHINKRVNNDSSDGTNSLEQWINAANEKQSNSKRGN